MDQTSSSINLVFLCSGLEPGLDGVGDYTRRLAAALISRGAVISVIALNDRFVVEEITAHQLADGVNVPVLRIPSVLTDAARYAIARDAISKQHPHWISLQFVPFGFHPKGLKTGLAKRLLSLTNTAKWHVMVHELWVGMDVESSVKHVIWGWAQRQIIRSLLKTINPVVITTQSLLYQFYLNKLGYNTKYLPLFSNIPVVSTLATNTETDKVVFLVLFGNIHYGAPVKDFVSEVAAYGNTNNINFALKVIGRCGPELNNWIREWQLTGLPVTDVGHQPEQRISDELRLSTIGITTTPLAITDKSGSFAAMKEHGLPVISVSRPWHPGGSKNFPVPNGVFYYQKGNFTEFYNHINGFKSFGADVQAVSDQLSNLLTAFNGKF